MTCYPRYLLPTVRFMGNVTHGTLPTVLICYPRYVTHGTLNVTHGTCDTRCTPTVPKNASHGTKSVPHGTYPKIPFFHGTQKRGKKYRGSQLLVPWGTISSTVGNRVCSPRYLHFGTVGNIKSTVGNMACYPRYLYLLPTVRSPRYQKFKYRGLQFKGTVGN